MTFIIWFVSIYVLSVIGTAKICKYSNDEIKRDDIPLILVPVLNTVLLMALSFIAIKESNAVKCIGDFIVKVLNKL